MPTDTRQNFPGAGPPNVRPMSASGGVVLQRRQAASAPPGRRPVTSPKALPLPLRTRQGGGATAPQGSRSTDARLRVPRCRRSARESSPDATPPEQRPARGQPPKVHITKRVHNNDSPETSRRDDASIRCVQERHKVNTTTLMSYVFSSPTREERALVAPMGGGMPRLARAASLHSSCVNRRRGRSAIAGRAPLYECRTARAPRYAVRNLFLPRCADKRGQRALVAPRGKSPKMWPLAIHRAIHYAVHRLGFFAT